MIQTFVIQTFVKALKDGKIMAVDWRNIDEMLGEAPNQKIKCSICGNDDSFPPIPEATCILLQEDVVKIIQQVSIQWMSFDYINGSPLARVKTRYFSVNKPTVGQWLKNPNKK